MSSCVLTAFPVSTLTHTENKNLSILKITGKILLEDFYHFLFSSHLQEFTVTLVDKFPLSSKLRTGKSTTASGSWCFQSSFVISDLRFFLAWMLLRQTNMFVDKDYIVIQLSKLRRFTNLSESWFSWSCQQLYNVSSP